MTLQAYLIGIGVSICSGRESWCLLSLGFLFVVISNILKYHKDTYSLKNQISSGIKVLSNGAGWKEGHMSAILLGSTFHKLSLSQRVRVVVRR